MTAHQGQAPFLANSPCCLNHRRCRSKKPMGRRKYHQTVAVTHSQVGEMVLSGFVSLSLVFSVFHPGTSPVSHYLGLGTYLLSGLLTRLPSQADFTYQPPCHLLLLWTAWHYQDGEAAVRFKCVLQVFMGWNLIPTMRLHIMGNLIHLRIHRQGVREGIRIGHSHHRGAPVTECC